MDAWRRTRLWARVGLGGIILFTTMVLCLHLLTLSDMPTHMSEYARTSFGWLWTLAALSLVVAGGSLTLAIQPYLSRGGILARVAVILLWGSCAGSLLVALFPVDTTPYATSLVGRIHNAAVIPTVLFLDAAILFLVPDILGRWELADLAPLSVVLGLIAGLGMVAYIALEIEGQPLVGPVQRLLVACLVAWLGIVGWRLATVQRAPVVV